MSYVFSSELDARGGVLPARNVDIFAKAAGDDLPIAEGQLAADIEQAAMFDDGHIGGDRRGGLGEFEAEGGDFGGDIHGVCSLIKPVRGPGRDRTRGA